MRLQRQKGELSLLWCAVLVGLFAFGAMAVLFSMRYNRNIAAEAWTGLSKKIGIEQPVQQVKHAAQGIVKTETATTTGVRKCMVNGVPMYSNVECSTTNPTSQKVELHDSRGIDSPKAPAVVKKEEVSAPTVQDNMIEQATKH